MGKTHNHIIHQFIKASDPHFNNEDREVTYFNVTTSLEQYMAEMLEFLENQQALTILPVLEKFNMGGVTLYMTANSFQKVVGHIKFGKLVQAIKDVRTDSRYEEHPQLPTPYRITLLDAKNFVDSLRTIVDLLDSG